MRSNAPLCYYPQKCDALLDKLNTDVIKLENSIDVKDNAIKIMMQDLGIYQLDTLEQQQEVVETIDFGAELGETAETAGEASNGNIAAFGQISDGRSDECLDALSGPNIPYKRDVRQFGHRMHQIPAVVILQNCFFFFIEMGPSLCEWNHLFEQ